MTVNNFFSSVDGQLELLAQVTLDSSVSSVGTLHALRPRLSCFHQLLLEPPEVGCVGWGARGWGAALQSWATPGWELSLPYSRSWSRCVRRGAAWPRRWETCACMWSSCWPAP